MREEIPISISDEVLWFVLGTFESTFEEADYIIDQFKLITNVFRQALNTVRKLFGEKIAQFLFVGAFTLNILR